MASLCAQPKKITIHEVLTKIKMIGFGHHHQAEQHVRQVLHADTAATKVEETDRMPYTYIVLTMVVPRWFPRDVVGGKCKGDESGMGFGGAEILQKFGSATQRSAQTSWFFKKIAH